jgi:hypothetical protein
MNPSRRPRAPLATALALMIAAAACGGPTAVTSEPPDPTPSPVPTATMVEPSSLPVGTSAPASVTPLGTTGRIVDVSNGYAITLPDGWVRMDLTKQDLESFIRAGLEAMSAEAAEALVEQVSAMSAAGIKFFAIDQDGATLQHVPNVTILSIPSGGLVLNLLEQTMVPQLRNSLPTLKGDIESERVALPVGESLRITYEVSIDHVAPGTSVGVSQFLILDETMLYFVTVSGPNTSEFAEEALDIASTFDFIE